MLYMVLVNIFNLDLMSGLFILITGFLSSAKLLNGRKMLIILIYLLVFSLWNIFWVGSSKIYELEAQ